MDDLFAPLVGAPEPDSVARDAVASRAQEVLRPSGAFSRLDHVAAWLAGWQRTGAPAVRRPAILIAAADHGVVGRGVSAYPSEITRAMVAAIDAGVATSSVLARQVPASLRLIDVGVGSPTADLTVEPTMSHDRFREAFIAGRDAVTETECDLLVLGEMGIGNTTAASAVAASLFGGRGASWVGRGSGLDDEGLARKIEVVEVARSRVPSATPAEVLRSVGGAELAALAGACLEARLRSIPVVLDGFVCTAAVAPLAVAFPGALDHCIAGHLSPEPGHALLLQALHMEPLLDLGLRLGEGSGALLAVPLIRMAAAAVVEVATFAEWELRR